MFAVAPFLLLLHIYSMLSFSQAAIVPLAKKLLHWTEVPISIFYSGAGVLVYKYITVCNLRYIVMIVIYLFQTVLSVVIVGLLSRKVPDR